MLLSRLNCRTTNAIHSILFFFRNIARSQQIQSIPTVRANGIEYRGMQRCDRRSMYDAYETLSPGSAISALRRMLYRFVGSRLVLVAVVIDPEQDEMETPPQLPLAAVDMYYFNKRDAKENTIHEGFIGVLPEYEGKGIATNMRRITLEHFQKSGLKGVSSRISVANHGSLRSAEKIGFKPVEEYYDDAMQAKRYYMTCRFEP